MNRYLGIVAGLALLLPGWVVAQGRGRHERITSTINDCVNRADDFKHSLHAALDHSRYRDTAREGQLNKDASRLSKAMNKVGDSWNRDHNPDKTRHFVSEAIEVSQDINRTMVRGRLDPEVERQWGTVRAELNRLADVFELPRIRW
jgi:hypothetical protein